MADLAVYLRGLADSLVEASVRDGTVKVHLLLVRDAGAVEVLNVLLNFTNREGFDLI